MRKHLGKRPSPSMGVALIALFIALGGTTYAATGGSFILGQANTAANSSALRSGVTTGPTLNVTNTGGRSAARFTANAGITPFSVSNSTKIGSLNSDLLDSLDSSAFLRTSGKAADANLLDGIDSTGFYAAGSKVADSELLDGYDANQLARAARGSNENGFSLFPSTSRATFVLTAPTSGFVFVSGWVSASSGDSTNCTPCYLHMRLRDVTAAAKSPDNAGEVNTAGDGFGGTSMAMSWVFPVAAGQRTFSLDADSCSPGCTNINSSVFFTNATLTALYVPFGSTGAGTLGAAAATATGPADK